MKFYGYIDSKFIVNSFLIPVYKNLETQELFFHSLSSDNKRIKKFEKFNQESYKKDSITTLKVSREANLIEAVENEESYFVLKTEKKIKTGSFSEMAEYLADKIAHEEITSTALIDNAKNIFSKTLETKLREFTVDVLSSIDGINKSHIRPVLEKSDIWKVTIGGDPKFEKSYEKLIDEKNSRVLWIPHNVDIKFTKNRIVLKRNGRRLTQIPDIPYDVLRIAESSNLQKRKIWRVKARGKRKFDEDGMGIYFTSKYGKKIALFTKAIKA